MEWRAHNYSTYMNDLTTDDELTSTIENARALASFDSAKRDVCNVYGDESYVYMPRSEEWNWIFHLSLSVETRIREWEFCVNTYLYLFLGGCLIVDNVDDTVGRK